MYFLYRSYNYPHSTDLIGQISWHICEGPRAERYWHSVSKWSLRKNSLHTLPVFRKLNVTIFGTETPHTDWDLMQRTRDLMKIYAIARVALILGWASIFMSVTGEFTSKHKTYFPTKSPRNDRPLTLVFPLCARQELEKAWFKMRKRLMVSLIKHLAH